MAMKKFYVGVKGIIYTNQGYLLLKHTKGHYDLPGGRIDDNENFEQTLRRELSEELPGINHVEIGNLVGSYRIDKDIDGDTSLVLLYFLVNANLPDPVTLSDEHESFDWVSSISEIPEELNPEMDKILRNLLKA